MKTLLKWLIITPIALAIIAFSIINRQSVPVILDPFGTDIPGLRFNPPLFIVMFACGGLGVLAGGVMTWFGQGKHRRAAREARAEVARLRAMAPATNIVALPARDRAA